MGEFKLMAALSAQPLSDANFVLPLTAQSLSNSNFVLPLTAQSLSNSNFVLPLTAGYLSDAYLVYQLDSTSNALLSVYSGTCRPTRTVITSSPYPPDWSNTTFYVTISTNVTYLGLPAGTVYVHQLNTNVAVIDGVATFTWNGHNNTWLAVDYSGDTSFCTSTGTWMFCGKTFNITIT
jgi:hypothetical protein